MKVTFSDIDGVRYILDISESDLFFGSVLVGTSSDAKTIEMTNEGWSDISLSHISLVGTGFSMNFSNPGVLLPSQKVTATITFDPNQAGIATGGIYVGTAEAEAAIIRLFGSGYLSANGNANVTGMPIFQLASELAEPEALNYENDTYVFVINDPVVENIGFYKKNGAAGAGTFDGPLSPYTTMIANASRDADDLALVINGAADVNGTGIVPTRTGGDRKTVAKMQADFEDAISDVEDASTLALGTTIPGFVSDVQEAVAEGVALINSTTNETVNSIIPGYAVSLFDALENTSDIAAATVSAVNSDRLAVANDRAIVAGMLASVSALPYSAVSQAQLFDAGGSININGTGMALPDSDNNIAIAPKTAVNTEALRGADTATRKAVAIGPYAFQYFSGYDSTGIGWRAGRWGAIDNGIIIGVHAGEKSNVNGRNIWGFGTRASGTVTMTGLPADGDTLAIAGVTFTAKNARAVAGEFTIGADVTTTMINLFQEILLVAQTTNALKNIGFRVNAAVLIIEAAGTGTYGNNITLEKVSSQIALSGATLTGGTLTKSTYTKQDMFSAIMIGVSAGKRADPVYARKARGTVQVLGVPAVGATLTIGIGTSVSAAPATGKTFTWVANGAVSGSLNVNQGTDKASSIANLLTAIEAYKAANPSHTALSTATFWASHRGLEVEYTATGTAGNTCRIAVTGANLSSPRRFLGGGIAANYNSGPIMLGANSESLRGANVVSLGVGAMSSAEAIDTFAVGSNSGTGCRGSNNIYFWGSGQNITGSYNFWFGQTLGGAATNSYIYITNVTAQGIVTLAEPLTNPLFPVGAKIKLLQRNTVSAGNLIKANGTNIANILATVISDTQLLIDDFLDSDDTNGGAIYTGGSVYSVTGTVTDIEVAPIASQYDWSTSWGDVPESGSFHLGATSHTKVDVRGEILNLPNNRYVQPGVNYGAAPATGNILFATAQGNFADGDTVTLNGTVFTAKTAASFAVPNTTMIRWFRIGADMYESLENLIRVINHSDDNSASSRAVKTAVFWLSGATGLGWRLNVRTERVLATGNNYTLATSKTGATVTAMSGGSIGTLPNALSIKPPFDGEERALSNWLSGRAYATWDAALGDWRVSSSV